MFFKSVLRSERLSSADLSKNMMFDRIRKIELCNMMSNEDLLDAFIHHAFNLDVLEYDSVESYLIVRDKILERMKKEKKDE